MGTLEFFGSIYFGDRLCKSIEIDGEKDELRISVDRISRVRGREWNFYDVEDVVDGALVFEGLKSVGFDPSGPVPNAWIEPIEIRDRSNGFFEFKISLGNIDECAKSKEIILTVNAASVAIESASGVRIRA